MRPYIGWISGPPSSRVLQTTRQLADMTETAFLSGKVLKRTLPAVHNPAEAGPSQLKRLLLPQGELAQFYDADEPVRYIAFMELREGSVRGNHYHKIKGEIVYMIQGEAILLVGDLQSGAHDAVPLCAGDLAIIPVGVAHAMRTVKPGQAIECSSARYDPTDTYRFPLT